jgi:hypothetical protein
LTERDTEAGGEPLALDVSRIALFTEAGPPPGDAGSGRWEC